MGIQPRILQYWLPTLTLAPLLIVFFMAIAAVKEVRAAEDVAGQRPHPQLPELNWEKRSDWLDVTRDVAPKAKGDGKADDTAAIQAALDRLSDWLGGGPVGGPKTIYFPPGTYRITKTLHNTRKVYGAVLIGCGRTTTIRWDGEAGKDVAMFWSDGLSHSRYVGIVWDGANKAGIGFRHATSTGRYFETQNMHQYEAFINCTEKGLSLGDRADVATDTTQIENCLFQNCGKGIAVEMFNFYHYPIVDCLFLDCGTGIYFRRGMGYVRFCHFERSRNEDVYTYVGNPVNCSVRWSTSVDSRRFITCAGLGWNSAFDVIDCQVSGWKDTEGAIVADNAGTMLFTDIGFNNPPGKAAPIKLINKYPILLTISNLKSPGTDAVLDPGAHATVVEVPAGKVKPIIIDARQSFFREAVKIPGKIFDAKRDFKAVGDGKADDTAALQAAIDAARAHGKGAMAYFPTGKYLVTKTLVISGGDYYVGGTGSRDHCVLLWGGADNPGLHMISVQQPRDVNLQYVTLETLHPNVSVLQQVGMGGPSRMCYEVVQVPGAYNPNTPRFRGFDFVGLTKGDVLIGKGAWGGDIRIANCGRATLLIDDAVAAPLLVEGAEPVRDGFIAFHTFMGLTAGNPTIMVKNNQNLVIGEAYLEQTPGTHVELQGNPGEPAGYVTIFGSERYIGNNTLGRGRKSDNLLVVNNYQGRYCEATNQFDYAPADGYRIVQTGDRPVDMIFLANCYMIVKPEDRDLEPKFELGKGANLIRVNDLVFDLVGSDKVFDRDFLGVYPERLPNVIPAGGLARVADALDDLRRLGETDLTLNHLEAFGKP